MTKVYQVRYHDEELFLCGDFPVSHFESIPILKVPHMTQAPSVMEVTQLIP